MANNKTIDIETLRAVADAMKSHRTTTHDSDSFADLTSGLRKNWIFLGALAVGAMWVIGGINTASSINQTQETKIAETAQAIINLNKSFDEFKGVTDNNYNELIRRMDSFQKDIEFIKTK